MLRFHQKQINVTFHVWSCLCLLGSTLQVTPSRNLTGIFFKMHFHWECQHANPLPPHPLPPTRLRSCKAFCTSRRKAKGILCKTCKSSHLQTKTIVSLLLGFVSWKPHLGSAVVEFHNRACVDCVRLLSKQSLIGTAKEINRGELPCTGRPSGKQAHWICCLTFNPSPLIISREARVARRHSGVPYGPGIWEFIYSQGFPAWLCSRRPNKEQSLWLSLTKSDLAVGPYVLNGLSP